jgi:hypothetical protein
MPENPPREIPRMPSPVALTDAQMMAILAAASAQRPTCAC